MFLFLFFSGKMLISRHKKQEKQLGGFRQIRDDDRVGHPSCGSSRRGWASRPRCGRSSFQLWKRNLSCKSRQGCDQESWTLAGFRLTRLLRITVDSDWERRLLEWFHHLSQNNLQRKVNLTTKKHPVCQVVNENTKVAQQRCPTSS